MAKIQTRRSALQREGILRTVVSNYELDCIPSVPTECTQKTVHRSTPHAMTGKDFITNK